MSRRLLATHHRPPRGAPHRRTGRGTRTRGAVHRGSTCPPAGLPRASPRAAAPPRTSARSPTGRSRRVDTRTGAVSVLAAGAAGRVTVGLDYEKHAHRIWAAGGPTGDVHVFDARTGALLRTYHFTSGFLNDVVVTRRAVYVTDSNVQQLIVDPAGPRRLAAGRLRGHSPCRSPATSPTPTGFNANGIVSTGRSLILVQSNTGLLFRVNPTTGATRAIDPAAPASPSATASSCTAGRCTSSATSSTGSTSSGSASTPRRRGSVKTITSPDLDDPHDDRVHPRQPVDRQRALRHPGDPHHRRTG